MCYEGRRSLRSGLEPYSRPQCSKEPRNYDVDPPGPHPALGSKVATWSHPLRQQLLGVCTFSRVAILVLLGKTNFLVELCRPVGESHGEVQNLLHVAINDFNHRGKATTCTSNLEKKWHFLAS